MAVQFPNIYNVEITKGPAVKRLSPMFYADKAANRIGANLFQNGQPYSPGGSCAGTAVLSDGTTVALTGIINGNQAYVDLTQACYSVPGPIRVFVSCVAGSSNITTVVAGFGNVTLTETGTIIDPGTIIPSVSALIAAIDEAVESIPQDYSVLSANMDALTHFDLSISGKYIASTGVETANSDYSCTDYIPVNGDSVLILDGFWTGTGAYAYMFYTAAKAKISGANSITTRTVVTTIPSTAAYVRFSSRTSQGETPVAYVSNHVVETLANLAPRMDAAEADVADLKSAVNSMTTATASDAGKALKAKTVSNGKVTEWEFGAAGGGGIPADVKAALLACFAKVAWVDDNGQDYYDALEAALTESVVSISAVYTQSGTVYTTDTLNSLKADLVVTATYDDSTTETVTAYTLSGTLTVGTSTITVAYGGKTTTFNVMVTKNTTAEIAAENYYIAMAGSSAPSNVVKENAGITIKYTLDSATTVLHPAGVIVCDGLFESSKGCLRVWNGDTYVNYVDEDNRWAKAPAESYTEFNSKSWNISAYDRIEFSVDMRYLDDSYMYDYTSGKVWFAGRNTPYFGMDNISEAN